MSGAIRLVPGVVGEAGNVTAACRRIGEELGINADTLHGWVGGDGTVRVWRLADRSLAGKPLRGHRGSVNAVAAGVLPLSAFRDPDDRLAGHLAVGRERGRHLGERPHGPDDRPQPPGPHPQPS